MTKDTSARAMLDETYKSPPPPTDQRIVHAVMYRDYKIGTLCDSGAWGAPMLFTMVTDQVTCPGCRTKLDGVPTVQPVRPEPEYVAEIYHCSKCDPVPGAKVDPGLLTEDEHRAIDMAGDLMALLHRIVGDGPQARYDALDLASAVHVIQRGVMKQAAARAYPDRYRLLGQEHQS